MDGHAVVVAGGGPTGLVLAAELKLAGIDVAILERRSGRQLDGSRAGGLHARTIELFDQRGIAERFLSAGQVAQVVGLGATRLDIADFPSRHPYGLALWQTHIERILADWVDELQVPVHRGAEIAGFAPHDDGVDIRLADGRRLGAGYLVGCDGGRSTVRKAAGIGFPGWDASVSHLIAEVELADEPEWGARTDSRGLHGLSRMEGGKVRVLVTEPDVGRTGDPTLADVAAALEAAYGTDYGIHSPTWISRFTDMARQAETYRRGRVLLAGDAAHVHYPAGGQGLNIGVQDAVNLGWKLALVSAGRAPESLLDTYHAERHPVAARVLRTTMAAVALGRPDERSRALAGLVGDMLAMDEPRRRIAGMMSGLDIRYDLGPGHPLLGRRMPDLDLVADGAPLRTFALLHAARPVLLDLGTPGGLDIAPWAGRVRHVVAACAGPWELPVLGTVPAPQAVLIRPDGHVAWVGEGSAEGLEAALVRWFGPPAAGQPTQGAPGSSTM